MDRQPVGRQPESDSEPNDKEPHVSTPNGDRHVTLDLRIPFSTAKGGDERRVLLLRHW